MSLGQRSGAGLTDGAADWLDRNAPALGVLAFLIVLWQVLAFFNTGGQAYFPSPAFAVEQMMTYSDALVEGFKVTLREIVIGYAFAIVIGIATGVLLTEIYTVRHMSMPLILFFHSIPLAILAPLFLGWFGTGIVGIGVYVAWGGFFPIFINTITGLTQIPEEFNLLSDITGATKWQRLRYIKVWTALPHITAGMKISANTVMIAAIIAEFLASGSGLGHTLIFAEQRALTGLLFGTVVIIFLLGLVWYNLISWTIDYLNPV